MKRFASILYRGPAPRFHGGLFVFLATSSLVFASGTRVGLKDAFATARGDAFVATADNPSAIYYNPAGITQLEGQNARGALNVVSVDSTFDRRSTRDVSTRDQFIPLPRFFYTYSPTNSPISF